MKLFTGSIIWYLRPTMQNQQQLEHPFLIQVGLFYRSK
ncbi:hypothetical protein SAMN05444586_10413 [Acinetobacter bohemicus]|uniref:Uncharacterized protein n=1 Tax=Acinetobacter bohemicus TaxID=1435036 RepID=A0A1I6W3W5_9GAMM|nr:hypothetical protein SAMN05444586_10413 [Acinetobacter bohemicus]